MNPIEKALELKRKHPNYSVYDWYDHFDIILVELGFQDFIGAYRLIHRRQIVWINSGLPEPLKIAVLWHELGHALLHRETDCYFIRYNTRFKANVYEEEADLFGAYMSDLPDEIPYEYKHYNTQQLASLYEVPEELVKIRYCLN